MDSSKIAGWRHTLLASVVMAFTVSAGCAIRSSGGDDDDGASGEGDDAGECSDGADNDGDGEFDCADSDCGGAPDCGGDDDTAADDDTAGDDDTGPNCTGDEVIDCGGGCTPATWINDGMCDASLDCSAFGRDGGDCCTTGNDCTFDEFCSTAFSTPGTCTPVIGTTFYLLVQSGSVPTYDSNGDTWDTLGGLPDIYAEIGVDGTNYNTTVVADSTSASWNQGLNFTPAGTSLCLSIYDEDVAVDDLIDGSCWNGTAGIVDRVRAGGYTGYLYNGIGWISVTITE